MDIYQRLSSNYPKYFYVCNNLYLDLLTKEEKDYLNNKIIINDFNFDDETFNFIESIYKKVINNNPNNALVSGIRCDEFNLNGMSDSE